MLRRICRWWRNTWDDIAELEQRRILMLEPWREEFLHMGLDGRLHGRFVPPRGRVGFRAGFSVTSSGWCPAVRGVPYRQDVN